MQVYHTDQPLSSSFVGPTTSLYLHDAPLESESLIIDNLYLAFVFLVCAISRIFATFRFPHYYSMYFSRTSIIIESNSRRDMEARNMYAPEAENQFQNIRHYVSVG